MTTKIQSFASNYGKKTTKCYSTKCSKLRKFAPLNFFQKSFQWVSLFPKSFSPLIKNQLVHHTSLTRKHFWIQNRQHPYVSYLSSLEEMSKPTSAFSVLPFHTLALLTFLRRQDRDGPSVSRKELTLLAFPLAVPRLYAICCKTSPYCNPYTSGNGFYEVFGIGKEFQSSWDHIGDKGFLILYPESWKRSRHSYFRY